MILCGALAACAPPAADDGGPPTASAVLAIRAGEAEVDSGDGPEAAEDGQDLAPGDVVTAVGDGAIVELAWSDGSVTRLGPDTVFTVGSPGEPLSTRGVQEAGISWNRVADVDQDAGATVPYIVDVAEGERAGDRGSLFVIDCQATPCRIVGTGGSGADGSKTSFRRGGVTTEIVSGDPAAWNQLMVDEWAAANADLDVEAGFLPVAELFNGEDPSRGLVDGTYEVLRTDTGWNCAGQGCSSLRSRSLGETRTLAYRFHTDCPEEGGPCSTMVDTQAINTLTNEIIDSTVPLVSGAESFAWGTDDTGAVCIWTYADGSTAETGQTRNLIRWEVTPTHAEVIDGVYRVTELTGGSVASLKIVEHTSPAFPGCETLEYEWDSSADLVLTWAEEG
ncbi:hypothetical protein [Microbacterium pumilum]|uniref:hypothetical protein n=1 Tax=Microbacterium pumilum TaxID=344165 RepID=UPI0031D9F06D